MLDVDCIVIGGGIIGLACARALAFAGRSVLVLEKCPAIGMETSSRNSEVIHAGIYYPSGSLKAKLCLAGRDALYDYCAARHIPHRRCGKLIVASGGVQAQRLAALYANAHANGVTDVVQLSAAEAEVKEPAVQCSAALFSPSSGIIDTHALMLAYVADIENLGGQVVCNSAVEHVRAHDNGFVVRSAGTEIHCHELVNAAGLWASAVARSIVGLDPAQVPETYLAKGNYFTLAGQGIFTHLVYPMPEPGGLGVHVTLDLAGQVRFGPDVEWVETIDYAVNSAQADKFDAAIRSYWPDLPRGSLQPGYSGIRPKLQRAADSDFRIDGPSQHGLAGLVNLYGIESPGITASMAIGQVVAKILVSSRESGT